MNITIKNLMIENDYVMECQPYEYWFFRIPEETYHLLQEAMLTFKIKSKRAKLVWNEYIGNQPVEFAAEDETEIKSVQIPAAELESGENMLGYKGDIEIVDMEFHYVDGEKKTFASEAGDTPLERAMRFLLNAQIKAPDKSQFQGSCYAIYDYTNQCHRMPCWLWSDAPIVSAALTMIKKGIWPERKTELENLAKEIGEVFLRTQITDEKDEIYGALVSRYRYYGKTDYSFNRLLGLNDTSFSVKWALLPLYEYTGDERYLKAARIALDWVEKNVRLLDFAPSHYYYENKVWENRAFVDTGFCAEGFEQYQAIVGDRDYRDTMEFLTKRFLKQFELETGYYGQNYIPGKGVDDRLFTRGHAWVLEGLLACYRGTGDGFYLEKAKELCYKMIELQQEGGEWNYLMGYNVPQKHIMEGSGICEKATAIFAYLFLEYCRLTPDEKIKASALKALRWCEAHMCLEEGAGFGGIMAKSLSSGITGLPFLNVATGYANAYYVLAKSLEAEC